MAEGVRADVLLFCAEINASFAQGDFEARVEKCPRPPPEESLSQLDASDASVGMAASLETSLMLKNPAASNDKYPSKSDEMSNDDNCGGCGHDSSLFWNSRDGKKGGGIKPANLMKLMYVEVMDRLKGAIKTGNFAELWDGPYLEMHGKDGVTFVSECTPFQQSQLIRQATALYYYYESLLEFNKKMKAYDIARTKVVGGLSMRTMIELVSSFEKNNFSLKANMKGHHERRWIVLNDDVWGKHLRDFVRTESVRKGRKNMTVKDCTACK